MSTDIDSGQTTTGSPVGLRRRLRPSRRVVALGSVVALVAGVLSGGVSTRTASGSPAVAARFAANTATIGSLSATAERAIAVTGPDLPTTQPGSAAASVASAATTLSRIAQQQPAPRSTAGSRSPAGSNVSGTTAPAVTAYGVPGAVVVDGRKIALPRDAQGDVALPPAPAGFADQYAGVYAQVYSVSRTLGVATSASLATPADEQAQVEGFSSDQLSALYFATQNTPGWAQEGQLLEAVDYNLSHDAGGETRPSNLRTNAKASRADTASPPSYTPAGDGASYSAFTCDGTDYNTTIEGLSIARDVAAGIVAVLQGVQSAIDDMSPAAIPLAVIISVGAGVAAALSVAVDAVSYTSSEEDNCQGGFLVGDVSNIDNTTYQTYQKVLALQTTVTQLAGSLTSISSSINAGSAASSSNSDTQQAEEQQLEALIDSDTQAITKQLTAGLGTDFGLVDAALQTIENAQTVDTQRLENRLDSDTATLSGQQDTNLRLVIEQGLAAPVGTAPLAVLELPSSVGGVLDATPVGVQEVCTDTLAAMKKAGLAYDPAANRYLATANQEVAAHNDKAAFEDFARAYQALSK